MNVTFASLLTGIAILAGLVQPNFIIIPGNTVTDRSFSLLPGVTEADTTDAIPVHPAVMPNVTSINNSLGTSQVEGISESFLLDQKVQSKVALPNDTYFAKQWALDIIGIPELWSVTGGNPEILVAILDTGIDQHYELSGRIIQRIDLTDTPTTGDPNGHGTHVAGIIAAESNNNAGITGLAPQSHIIDVRVADAAGISKASAVADGIIRATNSGANVINISIEFHAPSLELERAVQYAWNNGVLIIASAGNDGTQLPIYPAYYENCIAVAATKWDDTLAPLSNTGDWVDVAAPGLNIFSTALNNRFEYKSGTSFASAYVSGLAALLLTVAADENGNGKINDEVRSAIELGAQPLDISGVGSGRINGLRSLDILLQK